MTRKRKKERKKNAYQNNRIPEERKDEVRDNRRRVLSAKYKVQSKTGYVEALAFLEGEKNEKESVLFGPTLVKNPNETGFVIVRNKLRALEKKGGQKILPAGGLKG